MDEATISVHCDWARVQEVMLYTIFSLFACVGDIPVTKKLQGKILLFVYIRQWCIIASSSAMGVTLTQMLLPISRCYPFRRLTKRWMYLDNNQKQFVIYWKQHLGQIDPQDAWYNMLRGLIFHHNISSNPYVFTVTII